jgi:hypothetical protein
VRTFYGELLHSVGKPHDGTGREGLGGERPPLQQGSVGTPHIAATIIVIVIILIIMWHKN